MPGVSFFDMQLPQYGERLAQSIERDTGVKRRNLLEAFRSIPRERFLGPPPWLVASRASDGSSGAEYFETTDLASVYANVSIALDRDRQLFNGAPGIIATWLEALNPQPGERCYHVGCGTGYYTAILAALVGTTGSVVAVDVEESLVGQASDALSALSNVSILVADGTAFAPRVFDVGLVNTGLGVIPELWLSRLNERGGRLVAPLTVPLPSRTGRSTLSKGIVFLIERSGDRFEARMIGGAIIFSAAQNAGESARKRLLASFGQGDPHDVRVLRRDSHAQSSSCWLHERAYCLSSESLAPRTGQSV